MARRCVEDLPDQDDLAQQLGVSDESLGCLGLGWYAEYGCYVFPMRDAGLRAFGLRTRFRNGSKTSVRGSCSGIFAAGVQRVATSDSLWICEGPTDTAALLTVGLQAIGRPSNTGGKGIILEIAKGWKRREIFIAADRDREGSDAERLTMLGATELAEGLRALRHTVKIVRPPGNKDVREMVKAGATRETFEYLGRNAK